MSPIEQYLMSIGYERYRKVYNRKKKEWEYIKDDVGYWFSTTESGMLLYFYKKDDNEVIYGLNEKDKPPTLVWPRPENIYEDDEMNRILKQETPENIYKMLNINHDK